VVGRCLNTGMSCPHQLALAPCSGVPELLAPCELNLMVRFLTPGESLPPVDFSTAIRLLELLAPWVSLPELLSPC
jgi:hypothetical protein